jgi:capsular polysaccharide export protein
MRTVGVFSRRLARLPHLRELLGAERVEFRPSGRRARGLDAVVGWGHKPTARAAMAYAREHELPYVRLEDGFLRSVGSGPDEPPLSLVVDDRGIYYDARSPCRLEDLLNGAGEDVLADEQLLARARRCRARIAGAGLSKYNHASCELPAWLRDLGKTVLVVDQTRGDAAVELGGLSAASFEKMLSAALSEHPDADVIVKVHPDVVAGRKQGYLNHASAEGRVRVLATLANPVALLERAAHVYVCSSQLGFEAVLLGKPVSCFGAPFYAGWGLTDDRTEVQRRRLRRSVDQLAAAALILYPRYVHPVTGRRCEPEDVIEHLALQRRMFEKNRGTYYCFGFRLWKRRFVSRFMSSPDGTVAFVRSSRHALRRGLDARSKVLVWGSTQVKGLRALAEQRGIDLYCVEDGFLRSVGLGSDLTAPASLIVDTRGVYYDPRSPSDLEHILQTTEFAPEELDRARQLRARIVATGISKYNPAGAEPLRIAPRDGQRVVLVPGQVEDDASVRLGGGAIQTNQALLQAVRAACPDAYLLYKPHPDVVSGNRQGELGAAALACCDCVVQTASIDQCLAAAHEVHTLTSLVGFEALLRQLPVVTYGQPFYAGWGLTEDRQPVARRTRRLSIDELVAGVLIRYPRYYSLKARAFVTPEDILTELELERARRGASIPVRAPRAVRQLRRLWSFARELSRAS